MAIRIGALPRGSRSQAVVSAAWGLVMMVHRAVLVACSAQSYSPPHATIGGDETPEAAPSMSMSDAPMVDAAAPPSSDVRPEAPATEAAGDVDVPERTADAPDDASVDVEMEAEATPEASGGCAVAVASPPLLAATHVPIGSDIQWDSNPPSSGPHYPVWAAYQAYSAPVPRGYYVHDLEHGAIVFLYNCGDGGCPQVAAALQGAADSLPADPLCTSAGEGVRVRTIVTPDPLLDVPVAAAAWGWTYKASCVDSASLGALEAFAAAHYGNGPETLCSNGTTQF